MKLSSRLEPICARRFRRIVRKSAISFDTSYSGLTRRNFVIRPDVRLPSNTLRECGHPRAAAQCRFCCKSLFAQVIKNFPGCRRDFCVKMWGTSSPDDKLTGNLGNVIEATRIGGRRSDRLMAGKLTPGNFGLLQQYLPQPDSCSAARLFNHFVRKGEAQIISKIASLQSPRSLKDG
jgi:hypothetical protein